MRDNFNEKGEEGSDKQHLQEKAHPDPGIVMDLGSIGLSGTTKPEYSHEEKTDMKKLGRRVDTTLK